MKATKQNTLKSKNTKMKTVPLFSFIPAFMHYIWVSNYLLMICFGSSHGMNESIFSDVWPDLIIYAVKLQYRVVNSLLECCGDASQIFLLRKLWGAYLASQQPFYVPEQPKQKNVKPFVWKATLGTQEFDFPEHFNSVSSLDHSPQDSTRLG